MFQLGPSFLQLSTKDVIESAFINSPSNAIINDQVHSISLVPLRHILVWVILGSWASNLNWLLSTRLGLFGHLFPWGMS